MTKRLELTPFHWGELAYVPELVMSEIEQLYFFNTNLAFRHYASKLATAIRIFSHIKVHHMFVTTQRYITCL